MKKFLTLLLTLCIMASLNTGLTFSANASDSFVYDPAKSVQYAVAHWNDGVGVCDQFVKACLNAAGIEILAGDVDPVKNALVDVGYGTLSELILAADGVHITQNDNPGVKAGDVMFYYCGVCQDCSHTAIITGFDEAGNMKVAAHNPGVNDYVLHGYYAHTSDDGVKHEGGNRYYVVKMKTEAVHNHSFVSDQFEAAHPHAMYASCSCGAKYYLGWTATVKYCTNCVPPVGDAPVVTVSENSDGSIFISWTPVENVVKYEVQRAKTLNGTYFTIFEGMAATCTNKSVDSGQTYYYKVKAVRNPDSDSTYSEVVNITLSSDALMGDANSNGVVNVFDAKLVLEYCVGIITGAQIDLSVSDVNGNGIVNVFDAKMILEYCVGIITQFPVVN